MSNYTFHSQRAAAIKHAEAATKRKLHEFALTMQRKAKMKSPVAKWDPVHKRKGGNNMRSIAFDMPSPMQARVFTQSNYGGYLELGTSKMAARPYFKPAYEETKALIAKGNWDE